MQQYLHEQQDWEHNFGLTKHDHLPIIGKMFGVLVVQNQEQQLGYLAAFSGKLAGKNSHFNFVPPIFDTLTEGGFLSQGMEALAVMGNEIRTLETTEAEKQHPTIQLLKEIRKAYSVNLQQKLFDHYLILDRKGNKNSLTTIFKSAGYQNPPAGAGECAAPKLLQHAFQHQLKPLALAEFWWGQSPKSATWKHGHFYPHCKEKCEPILAAMLR